VDFHNEQVRDIDVSVHFNAYEQTDRAMGTECLYYSNSTRAFAEEVATGIAAAGALINRGPKQRTDLYFLTHTAMPAILIETCFVDSTADAQLYREHFESICEMIAEILGGEEDGDVPPPEPEPEAMFHAVGKCSYFGGADDQGVSPSEGLAFISTVGDAPQLFMPVQPAGTTGLARRLNSEAVSYVACRWVYSDTPKEMLLEGRALVRALKTGRASIAYPADWGPNENTGRIADLSPWLMENLGIETDDEVEVIFPYQGE
jgi:N-acetylmuramoyl-L-alanine amidase